MADVACFALSALYDASTLPFIFSAFIDTVVLLFISFIMSDASEQILISRNSENLVIPSPI